jgi:Flp pilus assembly protein TadG
MTMRAIRSTWEALGERVRGDQGSFTVELVLWTPFLAAVLALIVASGRIVAAGSDATGASRDAARAASLQTNMTSAKAAAQQAARDSFGRQGDRCHKLTVDVRGSVAPGGLVTVSVSCTARLSDLAIPGAPGSRTLSATSTVPIETTRSIPVALGLPHQTLTTGVPS